MNDVSLFGSIPVDFIVFLVIIIAGVTGFVVIFKKYNYDVKKISSKKMKICPLCRSDLEDEDELFGRIKAGTTNKVVILGCKYCYKRKD